MPTTVVPNASGQESHIHIALDTDDDALQQQSILSKSKIIITFDFCIKFNGLHSVPRNFVG